MRPTAYHIWTLRLILLLMLLVFNSCSNGFSSDSLQANLAELSSHSHSAPHITSVSSKINPNINIEFKVYEETPFSGASYTWSHKLGNIPNVCQIISGSTSKNYILNCANSGSLVLSLQVLHEGKILDVEDYVIPIVLAETPPSINLNVTFSIPAGTGNKSWNSVATPIEVYVGQTLTFKNDDSVTHQMHTGGKPCPHSGPTLAGGQFNCVITEAYNSITSGNVYEHSVGPGAAIYIISHDGAQLYSQNCMGCHGALATSEHKSATYGDILNALINVTEMSTNSNLMKLNKKQIEAIAYALSK